MRSITFRRAGTLPPSPESTVAQILDLAQWPEGVARPVANLTSAAAGRPPANG